MDHYPEMSARMPIPIGSPSRPEELSAGSATVSRHTPDEEYEIFVRTRQQMLIGFAYLLTGSHHDAQDLVQSALVKAYLKWSKLRDGHNVDAYVRKIIVNEHASNWRRAWRRRERSTGDVRDLDGRAAVDHGPTGEDIAWQKVLELPAKQRSAIALRFYEDLSVAETADILGCSVGTVKSQTSRAIATLRHSIDLDDLGVN